MREQGNLVTPARTAQDTRKLFATEAIKPAMKPDAATENCGPCGEVIEAR